MVAAEPRFISSCTRMLQAAVIKTQRDISCGFHTRPLTFTFTDLVLCCRRAKRRRAEAEGLEEAAAMGGYETSGYGGYMSAGPSSSYFMGERHN